MYWIRYTWASLAAGLDIPKETTVQPWGTIPEALQISTSISIGRRWTMPIERCWINVKIISILSVARLYTLMVTAPVQGVSSA